MGCEYKIGYWFHGKKSGWRTLPDITPSGRRWTLWKNFRKINAKL